MLPLAQRVRVLSTWDKVRYLLSGMRITYSGCGKGQRSLRGVLCSNRRIPTIVGDFEAGHILGTHNAVEVHCKDLEYERRTHQTTSLALRKSEKREKEI
jgi:hypothetical protein